MNWLLESELYGIMNDLEKFYLYIFAKKILCDSNNVGFKEKSRQVNCWQFEGKSINRDTLPLSDAGPQADSKVS